MPFMFYVIFVEIWGQIWPQELHGERLSTGFTSFTTNSATVANTKWARLHLPFPLQRQGKRQIQRQVKRHNKTGGKIEEKDKVILIIISAWSYLRLVHWCSQVAREGQEVGWGQLTVHLTGTNLVQLVQLTSSKTKSKPNKKTSTTKTTQKRDK